MKLPVPFQSNHAEPGRGRLPNPVSFDLTHADTERSTSVDGSVQIFPKRASLSEGATFEKNDHCNGFETLQ